VSNTALHLRLEKGKEGVALVLHEAAGDALEGRLEGSLLDLLLGCGISDGLLDLLEGTKGNLSKVVSEVLVLVILDHLEHVVDSAMEVLLKVQLLISEEVNESTLLDIIVFRVDADVFHLLLGVSEVSQLFLFASISPGASELLGLITGVDIVENGELGADEVGEVTDLNVTEIEGNEELVMEDHATDPFIVGPATESRDGVDGADVSEDEQETASASRKALVVGGDLLGADSLEESLHVVEVREDQGILVAVIGVHITLAHILKILLIVALAVLSLVGRLDNFLGLGLDVLHLSFEGSFELGLNVEGHREGAACRDQALVQE